MTEQRTCAYEKCSETFIPKRPHQRFHAEPCRYAQWELEKERHTAQVAGQRVEEHPLQEVRDQRATDKHKRDLGGLIKQAIVDTIRTKGQCHPDDLLDLYPEGERDLCRRLATAQFGSMCAARDGHGPLIQEIGRRKSSIPERKGAKAGIYSFTQYGRETLVGISGVGIDHRGDGEGEGASGRLAHPPSSVDVNSGDPTPGSVSPAVKKSSAAPPPTAAADPGSPDSLFEADSECSAYQTWEAA